MDDYSIHSENVKAFDNELAVLIQKGTGCFDETTFNRLALQEFAIQYHNVELFRQLCDSRGVHPAAATSWEQIPALPSEYFKKSVVASFPLSETELTLMTSGTSNPNLLCSTVVPRCRLLQPLMNSLEFALLWPQKCFPPVETQERSEKLKGLCPVLQLQGLVKKA